MAEKKKRRRAAVGLGAAGAAICAALITVGGVIGLAGGGAPVASAESGETAKDWAAIATAAMARGGFEFGAAQMDGRVLTITGDAPNAAARTEAYQEGVAAVQADRGHVGQVLAFNNSITIAGIVQAGVPDAASALGETPEAGACQSAYDTLLDGRVINFNSGSALIATESSALLDALSDVAMRCVGYRVEVRGHTDSVGDAAANQALSERRAQSVADYLVRRGVSAAQIGVSGLGESEPLDSAETAEAQAKNRRIEFKVAATAATP
jgi:outer membrane protein OmpA-like peptidoglycan-associated protein